MTLLDRIKEISKKRGLSVKEVSKRAGFGERTIYRWDTNNPSTEKIKAVADVLGVSVDYLLGNTDEMHSNKKDDMPVDLEEVLDKLGPTLRFEGKELTDEQKIKLYEMAKLMLGE